MQRSISSKVTFTNQACYSAHQNKNVDKFEITQAELTWEGWIIHVKTPQQNDYPVYLSRSGFISGIGG